MMTKTKILKFITNAIKCEREKTQNNANSIFSTKILILYFSFNKTGTILPLFELKHGTRKA